MFTKQQAHTIRQWQKALDAYRRLDNELTKAIEARIGERQLTALRAQVESARANWQMWEERASQLDV